MPMGSEGVAPAEPLIDGLVIGQPRQLTATCASNHEPPGFDSLSEYAKAAINSLRSRNNKKVGVGVRPAAVEEPRRRIRGKTPPVKVETTGHAEKRAKVKTANVKTEVKKNVKTEVKNERLSRKERANAVKTEAQSMPTPPPTYPNAPALVPTVASGSTDGPTHDYRGGRIYWKANSFAFRVIRERGMYKSERKIRWETKTPKQSEWDAARLSICDFEA